MDIFNILQSPDDGTPVNRDLISEGGVKYEKTKSGILIFDSGKRMPSEKIYNSKAFNNWNSIIDYRIKYYTQKKSIAGLLANYSYRNIRIFNRTDNEWLLDVGCGDGAQVALLKDRKKYIGIDKNIDRLEILKKKYPETNAIYCDASSLPFKGKSIGNVFSSNAFEHFWYLKDTVLDLYRCLKDSGVMIIVVPTEGGAWNIGRNLISRPHFKKKYPEIDFDFISHAEHCNNASQIKRSLELLFDVKTRYRPFRVPSIWCNIFLEFRAKKNHERKIF